MGSIVESARLRLHLAGRRAQSRPPDTAAASPPRDLEARVARLEAEVEALQDSTYRQDVMHDAKIADLRHNQTRE